MPLAQLASEHCCRICPQGRNRVGISIDAARPRVGTLGTFWWPWKAVASEPSPCFTGGSDHRRESLRLGMPRHPPIPQVRGRLAPEGEAEGSFSQIQDPHPAGRGVTDSHKARLCLLVGWGSQSSAFSPPEERGLPSRATAMPTGAHTLIFPVRATPAPPSFAPHCWKAGGGERLPPPYWGALATSPERDWPAGL